MNSIFHRVSIRKYQQCAVPDKLLTLLLRAAMAAPSAGNQQPWEFCVVRNREMLDQLAACSPYAKPFAVRGAGARGNRALYACRLPFRCTPPAGSERGYRKSSFAGRFPWTWRMLDRNRAPAGVDRKRPKDSISAIHAGSLCADSLRFSCRRTRPAGSL